MDRIGLFLKEQRLKCNLSLSEVYKKCGITDSKLSKQERGKRKPLAADELKKLGRLYKTDVVSLFLMAGYLDKSDLSHYQAVFKNAELLTDDEVRNIQLTIDLFTKGRKRSENDL